MSTEKRQLLAFNRGVVSSRGLGRIDLDRMAMSADQQSNFVPRVLGSMMLRPGLEYIDNVENDNFPSRNMPFVFEVDDTALLEISGAVSMRIRIDDELLTRPAVSSTITDPGFNAVLGVGPNDWRDQSDTGGTADTSGGHGRVKGDGTDFGIIRQMVSVAGADQNVEHGLAITIDEGPVLFRVGSTAGDDDYISETRLGLGQHRLSLVPTGDFYIEFANEREFFALIESCNIDDNNVVELNPPWSEEDLPFLRWSQSGDVIYVTCKNATPTGLDINAEIPVRIERRGDGRSWSIVKYHPEDGPFRVQNTSKVTIAPSALVGDITLTASKPIFRSTNATGSHRTLYRVASQGQTVTKAISGADDWTDPIRVVGSEAAREFGIIIEGTFVATVKLQFAYTEDGPWNDQGQTWTAPVSTTFNDGQDEQIIFYRIGVDTGDYTSGTVTTTLVYTGGSIQGVAMVTGFTSSTVVDAKVLKAFGSISASADWWEGEWSARRGYPTAVDLNEGRLWLAGNDKIIASVSDNFESFDDNVEGDSGPISRTIGQGPIRTIHWLMSLARLLMGTSDTTANIQAQRMDGNNPLEIRSSNFDEPVTPTNFNIKPASSKGVFVDRTGQRLYELSYDIDIQGYKSIDLSVFTPDYNVVGIKQIAVQMKPDIRIHCVRNDGTVGMLVYDRLENVICWCEIDSSGADGEIEDVAVLPGTVEDQVYYIVKRTINGATERHICKWAMESEAIGGLTNKMADSFVHYSGTATTSITGLGHLEGETVSVWADGAEVDDAVVVGGEITLVTAASEVIAGLPYVSRFKGAKLASIEGIGLLDEKKVNRIGFLLENTHHQGLQYGPDFDNLYDLPAVEDGQETAADTIYAEYHEQDTDFGGEWDEDSRICLQAQSPRPCTLLAVIAEMESVKKTSR